MRRQAYSSADEADAERTGKAYRKNSSGKNTDKINFFIGVIITEKARVFLPGLAELWEIL